MPSSGSDWFAGCVEQCGELKRPPGVKEFFNPICNQPLYDELAQVVGCETVDTYWLIAAAPDAERKAIFGSLVRRHFANQFTFTKEVWLGFQAELLLPHFACVGLVRSARHTFPPHRLRVWQWYNAIYWSLRWHSRLLVKSPQPLATQAAVAHSHLYAAIANTMPCLRHEDLMFLTRRDLVQYLAPLSAHVDCEKLARVIVETRQQRPRPA